MFLFGLVVGTLFGVVVTSLLVMAAMGDWVGDQRMDDE